MKSMIETATAIRSGAMSAVEAVNLSLERIAARDEAINAFVTLDAKGALAAARAVDAKRARGENIGPLGGVPFGAKDNEAVIGMPTRRGSLLCKDAAPENEDCIPIARLRRAGAIPLGKV